jgi:hypothetical protein
MNIEDIDKNFVAAKVGDHEVDFYDVTQKPFGLTGFPWFKKEKVFCRLPVDSIEKMERIRGGAWHTSGGRIRFRTDSRLLAVRVKLLSSSDMSHMPRTGSAGVDLYLGKGKKTELVSVAKPGAAEDEYEMLMYTSDKSEMLDWTLNFPLYNGVKQMSVGIAPGAKLRPPAPFSIRKPILFYGGSITQGGCASRPGNGFAGIICDRLDAPLINLGFSGCARLEPVMADLIASLDLGVLMIDTTNTSVEEKKERYEPFFKRIRSQCPNLPIVLGCRADWRRDPSHHRARRAIVMRTYQNALKRGDKRVLFADGKNAYGKYYNQSTVDGCHPNDLGFMQIAEACYPTLKKAVKMI